MPVKWKEGDANVMKRKRALMTEADEWVNAEPFTITLQRHMLDWCPVRPTTVRITVNRQRAGVLSLTDDGFGVLRDRTNQDRGSINYTSGQIDLEDIPNGTPCLAQYAFNSTPTLDSLVEMKLTSTPIHAKVHKLKEGAKIVYNIK
jgi:hypothetical protein